MSAPSRNNRQGFTLVELLVVIAIIGVLIALLLPAIQMAREAARRVQCRNNLKQIGMAVLTHENSTGHYPTNGWGWTWVGDPDRGFGDDQPGGWIYNILPFMEQQQIHDMGSSSLAVVFPSAIVYQQGGQGGMASKALAAAEMCRTPINTFICPSRRPVEAFDEAASHDRGNLLRNVNVSNLTKHARTDYAMNVGDYNAPSNGYSDIRWPGPSSLSEALDPAYRWPDFSKLTGITHVRSKIKPTDVEDGTANTYMVGEKYIDPNHYYDGEEWGDDQPMYIGHDWDLMRWASATYELRPDHAGTFKSDPLKYSYLFGSAHATGINFVFCDGSVHTIPYEIELQIHARLGNRADGLAVDKGEIVQ